MTEEKYLVVTTENSFHIAVRNILNPLGYMFLGNGTDSITLMRLVRCYNPDFIVVDLGIQWRELKHTLETIDDEMLCFCILIGDYKEIEILDFLENTKVISFCSKPLNRDMLIQTVDMASMNYRRVFQLDRKLKEATEKYEEKMLNDKAKRILMEEKGLSESEAYKNMRKRSMDTRTSMKDVAEFIIYKHQSGSGNK
jgi:response regulator NasT